MVMTEVRRVLSNRRVVLYLCISCLIHSVCPQIVPKPFVKIEALMGKGFRATLTNVADYPDINLLVFQGNINRELGQSKVGEISIEVTNPKDGQWIAENPELTLNRGDVIQYHLFIGSRGKGFISDDLTYKIATLQNSYMNEASPSTNSSNEKPPSTVATSPCHPTITRVRGVTSICSGQTIFEDTFDNLREDVWRIQQYVPLRDNEYPFVSHQRSAVSVSNGFLFINAKLQEREPGFSNQSIISGSLNLLDGCTSNVDDCLYSASGALILPPVVSGRISSQGFEFAYGTVTVRAKFPRGDWLYPEILLEPFLKKYGTGPYASGLIKIACVRGNEKLRKDFEDYSNKQLYAGLIMDKDCRNFLMNKIVRENDTTQEFHDYSVNWTPDQITFYIDKIKWMQVNVLDAGYVGQFPPMCKQLPRQLLAQSTRSAPFDQYFYLTLGLAAGGVTEFPDDVLNGVAAKPWKNQQSKAMLNFWRDLSYWYPTWKQPSLTVDYVKVVAL